MGALGVAFFFRTEGSGARGSFGRRIRGNFVFGDAFFWIFAEQIGSFGGGDNAGLAIWKHYR
jgi:hypothetical protein